MQLISQSVYLFRIATNTGPNTKGDATLLTGAYMQNRLTNSQRYLVNAKPGTNHSTNPTNPNGNSKQ